MSLVSKPVGFVLEILEFLEKLDSLESDYLPADLTKIKKKVNNKMARTNFDQLLQAGCHFGHLKRKWNPAMAPYIYTERNGIHIIDLHKTAAKIDEAAEALKQIAKSGKKVLFVARP